MMEAAPAAAPDDVGRAFRLGLGRGAKVGAAAVLVLWLIWDFFVDPPLGADVFHDPALRVYRCVGNLILLLWCWLLSTHLWPLCGIDYVKLLNLSSADPAVEAKPGAGAAAAGYLDPKPLQNCALDLTLAFLLSLLCFYKAIRGVFLRAVSPSLAHLFPLALVLYAVHRATTPWKDRKPVFVAVARVLAAPFGAPVTFADGYVGDVLTSLARVLVDLAFTLLFFLAGTHGWATSRGELADDRVSTTSFFRFVIVPALTAGPLWWRFSQNLQRAHETQQRWPHVGNALKYASAQTVSLWGVWRPELLQSSWAYVAAFVFTTLYQFTWDITMDWGLLKVGTTEGGGLGLSVRRRRLVAGGRLWVYYAAAATNFVLRFVWTLSLLPERGNDFIMPELQLYLSPVIAAAEILRRTLWAVFRLEWEQLQRGHAAELDAEPGMEAVAAANAIDGDWQSMDVATSSALYLPAKAAKIGAMYFGADVHSSGAFIVELGALAALVVLMSGLAAL
mmetsp:Transcript_698/g.1716  ORF Transcript_698/g.1716 Transcript_698/m.1716 type:complete len:505 (-) Transcript_698:93-1607(-)